jgi:hypothetical protein
MKKLAVVVCLVFFSGAGFAEDSSKALGDMIKFAAKNAAGCVSGNCVNGKGIMALGDGARYEGEFKNGKYEGQGIEIADGGKYEGEWKNGHKEGLGTHTIPGLKYVGEFKEDMYNGEGTLFFSNGKIAEKGIFKDDKLVAGCKRTECDNNEKSKERKSTYGVGTEVTQ